MKLSNANECADPKESKLPRRDWILLPVLSLLTIGLLLGSTELIARRIFFTTEVEAGQCKVRNDRSIITRRIPGCVCSEKIAESRPVEYRFNSSGYRADKEFGPKLPSTYRIVVVGSCFAMGLRVPIEETFTSPLPAELSKRTGRKVEILNEAMEDYDAVPQVASVALRFDDALAAKPDMILWTLNPWDIERASLPSDPRSQVAPGSLGRIATPLKNALPLTSIPDVRHNILQPLYKLIGIGHTNLALMLRHFLLEVRVNT
jgi:hypothetical protein